MGITHNRGQFKSPTMKLGGVTSPVHSGQQFNTSLQINSGQVSNPFTPTTSTTPAYNPGNTSMKVMSRPATNQQAPSLSSQGTAQQPPLSFMKHHNTGVVITPNTHQTNSTTPASNQFYWKKQ